MIDIFAIKNCTALFIQKPKKDLGFGGYFCKLDFSFVRIFCYLLYLTIIFDGEQDPGNI